MYIHFITIGCANVEALALSDRMYFTSQELRKLTQKCTEIKYEKIHIYIKYMYILSIYIHTYVHAYIHTSIVHAFIIHTFIHACICIS